MKKPDKTRFGKSWEIENHGGEKTTHSLPIELKSFKGEEEKLVSIIKNRWIYAFNILSAAVIGQGCNIRQ
ncbi:MAG: hypothetical protein IKX24_01710 [Prevotella sp.]|nr:hypothetical protein [Prevotella sp.]MBR5060840.1 hypothetical protein [Prevotella sp.]